MLPRTPSESGSHARAVRTSMSVYVIAMRGERSSAIPTAWIEAIRDTAGVSDVATTAGLLRVSASDAALAVIRQRFGAQLIIEPAAAYSIPQ